ncbi:caspase family protein [Agromyces sp. SYSU T00266]|uniref:caspase family protein n=1 Tax=Agromyces zhanjiangensis TaxID=3158562 RepID=UPI003398F537
MLGMNRAVFARTLRQGHKGEDVRRLQEMLTQAGFDPGPIDGDFGPRTHAAVLAFQRSADLVPDGLVGPLTTAALTEAVLGSGAPSGHTPTGLSLHIGVNNVDPAAYPFHVPPLAGCINDANDMRDLAQGQGFRVRQLLDGAATSAAVIDGIRTAAQQLGSGDIFLITYSGHGSQVPDPAEDDQRSETWVLWDRQLIDDELYALWGLFRPDVRIIVISDSCHSGTVTRELNLLTAQLSQATERALDTQLAAISAADAARVALALSDAMAPVLERAGDPRADASRDLALSVISDLVEPAGTARSIGVVDQPRLLRIEDATRDVTLRADLYREAIDRVAGTPPPRCKVLLISGCQDNQTSSDGRPDASGHQNGAFTKELRLKWAAARDYADLHARILADMPSTQSPNLFWATPRDPAFEGQRPFTV